MTESLTWTFKARTDIWTGDAKRDGKRLVTTGLLGSIRWWFEVLVRGLGGYACDPSGKDNGSAGRKDKEKCEGRNHCVVCELFGCTGWARKFRFDVLDKEGGIKTDQIKKDDEFQLRFTPLRPIRIEEWNLLDATLRLIAEYGAIGGRTVFKPSGEKHRQREQHHQDFGLIGILRSDHPGRRVDITKVRDYVCGERWRKPQSEGKDFFWASLKHFWFVDGKTLGRENVDKSTFNKVLGRKESKACHDCGRVHNPTQKCPETNKHPRRDSEHFVNHNDEISKWLAGSQRESKKVFSFKNPPRTFGFVKPGLIDLPTMKKRLQEVWGNNSWEFLTGEEIIVQLFAKGGDHS
jgi:CRISPR-associated protein Cmr1